MLKKYIDFITESNDLITESQLIELLLESDVMFSDNFKKVLGKIDSPVAKKILGLEKKDLPVVANYFDIDPERNDYLYFTETWFSYNRNPICLSIIIYENISLISLQREGSSKGTVCSLD
jgi:hypothetical protein